MFVTSQFASGSVRSSARNTRGSGNRNSGRGSKRSTVMTSSLMHIVDSILLKPSRTFYYWFPLYIGCTIIRPSPLATTYYNTLAYFN